MSSVTSNEFYAQWRPEMQYAVWSETKEHVVDRMKLNRGMKIKPSLVRMILDSSRAGKHVWVSFALGGHVDAGLRGIYISTNKVDAVTRYKLHGRMSNMIKMTAPQKYSWEIVEP